MPQPSNRSPRISDQIFGDWPWPNDAGVADGIRFST